MSTDRPSSRGLSPSWLSSISRRGSRATLTEGSAPDPRRLLVPSQTSKSSDSGDSRSVRSNASRGRKLIRDLSKRLRSSSNASVKNRSTDLLQEEDFREVEGWINGFEKYNRLVTNQVSKDQSYSAERFSKICKILTKQCGGGFVHALPEGLLDLALLWCPSAELRRNAVGTSEPSWSWAGWEGTEAGNSAVNFPFDPTSCPDIRKLEGDFFRSEIKHFYLGPLSARILDESRSELYEVRREKKRVRIQYPPYFHAPWGNDSAKETDTLHFIADTTPASGFGIVQLVDDDDKDMPISELMDEKKRQCGVIMDYKKLVSVAADVPGPLHESAPGSFEFVLLSRNRRCEPNPLTRRPAANTAHPPGTPIWNGERFLWDQQLPDFDQTYEEGEWKMLNVMLIQHLDEGYAERVAIGRIHEDAWKAREITRKEIVLR